MTTQSITYCTNQILPCESCLPSDVIFCVPNVITVDGQGFISASLLSFVTNSNCGVNQRVYTFNYDDSDLADPNTPLLSCEISSVFCADCQTRYLESITQQLLIGWETDAEGNLIQEIGFNGDLIYNHEFTIRSNDDSGDINICGGSSNSTSKGAIIQLQGVSAGGGAYIYGAFAGGGNVHLVQGAPGTFISIENYLSQRLWGFASNGELQGDSTLGGDIVINRLGKTLQLKSGANAAAGTFTANGTSAVVVANTLSSTVMVVVPSLKTIGGTPAGLPYMSAISAGVSFSMKSFAGDTSVYNYVILGTF